VLSLCLDCRVLWYLGIPFSLTTVASGYSYNAPMAHCVIMELLALRGWVLMEYFTVRERIATEA
jgi:hypothetical protein